MNRTCFLVPIGIVIAGLAGIAGSFALGQPAKDTKAKSPPEVQLPPGWTEADMQACVAAGTPGKMHEHLAKSVGLWTGATQMFMGPGSEPMKGECTLTVTSLLEGRYTRGEMTGEMPGMGPYTGLGVSGFDNVSHKFVSDWIDNFSTGIMNGTGELSKDGKTLTWNFTYNCPLRNKPASVRQIETITGANTMSFEMFTSDPKSGKEYKCMHVDFTRKP